MFATNPSSPSFLTPDIGATDIILKWSKSPGEVTFYEVDYSPVPDNVGIIPPIEIPSASLPQFRFIGLSPNTDYTFMIKAVSRQFIVTTSGVQTVEKESVDVTRIYRTRPLPPRNLRMTEVTPRLLSIQWEGGSVGDSSYRVSWKLQESESVSTDFVTTTTYTINNLIPYKFYEVTVITTAGLLQSEPATLRQRTLATDPGVPRDFNVVKTSPKSARTSWYPPVFPHGILTSYNITISSVSQNGGSPRTLIIRASNDPDQFHTYSITGLDVGNAYRFSISVNNNVASSAVVQFPTVLQFPQTAPPTTTHKTGLSLNAVPTGRTVTISLSNQMFSQEYGPIIEYAVLVAEITLTDANFGQVLPPERTWASVQGTYPWLPYRASEPSYNPFINVSGRKKRQTDETFVDFTVGADGRCDKSLVDEYCNGPLTPYSTYQFAVRAYGADGNYTDTIWSDSISTRFEVLWFIYPLVGMVMLVILILIIFCCMWRGCCGDPSRNAMYEDKDILIEHVRQPSASSRSSKDNANDYENMRNTTSRPVAVNKFAQHVARMSANNNKLFSMEYESLQDNGANQSRKISKFPENMAKNRYRNILPNDDSRVKLMNSEDGSDYINASYLSGLNTDKEYIATQGPMPDTLNDFWTMVWEQKTASIIMVTNLVENSRVKSEQYWPNDDSVRNFGDIHVSHINTVTKPSWTIRTLELEKEGETHMVNHFHFRSWGDHGVPSTPDPMLFFMRTFQKNQAPSGPVVVHCSAGVGRSGTFVTLDILLRSLDNDAQFLDVYGTVANMRQSRCHMVQTEDQYIFIHKVLLKAIQNPNMHVDHVAPARDRGNIDNMMLIDDNMFE